MKKCIICGSAFFPNSLIELKNMPTSAQNIPNGEELSEEHGLQLQLFQCRCCGLVQFDTPPVDYYKKVIRAGGGTTTMINLRQTQYADFITRFNLTGKKIVEIGCGQGEFLSILSDFDVKPVGIEYSQELVEKAIAKGLTVYRQFVDNKDCVIQNAPYDAFVQFNFLEHQPNPNGMLEGIYNNLTDNGVGLVTVPSLEYILNHDGYYELIRDHIAYYSEETLKFLFQKNGFEIIECKTVNRDTHTIIVRKRKPLDVTQWIASFVSLEKEFNSFFRDNQDKSVAIWGASHQGFTVAATLELTNKISYIIDSATFKQGKYAPVSHIPIVSPDYSKKNPVDIIIIIAPGYTEEIVSIIRKKFSVNIKIAVLRTKHLEILK
jgi:SAM-dependent methyltransferase